MLGDAPHSFINLPGERPLYRSPARTTFSLTCSGTGFSSSAGVVHLTNQRIVYTPTDKTPTLESFSCPITNVHDSRVSAPFFGPNVWQAVIQPVPNGGIIPSAAAVELKLVFKDGGAFDFHSTFERLKERVQQVVENNNSQDAAAAQRAALNVHLEDLPAYEEATGLARSPVPAQSPEELPTLVPDNSAARATIAASNLPDEPPPGYEEVQLRGVESALGSV